MDMKTAISIPDPLFRAAERLARRMHMSRSRLYQSALARFVEEHTGRDVTSRLNEVYGSGGGASDSLPGDIAAMQDAAVGSEDW